MIPKVAILFYLSHENYGAKVRLSFRLSTFNIQFFCHWYYTIFGASESKLKGYNEYFKDTVRLIPMSEKRLIPDLYHIILHILILLNIVLCAISH